VGQQPHMLSPVCRNCGAQWGRIAGSLDPLTTIIPEVAMCKKKARTRRNKKSTVRMKNPPHPGDLIRTEVIEGRVCTSQHQAKVSAMSLVNG
jgi:hypothetical protein